MWKALLFLFYSFSSLIFYSQTLTDWKVDGNAVSTDSKLGTNTGYDLIIETNNLERMRFTDNGNLGIGIHNPLSKLHLVGDMRIEGNLKMPHWIDVNETEPRIIQIDNDGTFQILGAKSLTELIYKYDCTQSGTDPFEIPVWKSEAVGDVGVLHTGVSCPARVGIGIAHPDYELQVDGTTHLIRNLIVGNDLDWNMYPWWGPLLAINASNGFGLGIASAVDSQSNAFQVVDDQDYIHTTCAISGAGEIKLNYFGTEDPFSIGRGTENGSIFRIRPDGGIDIRYNNTFDPLVVTNANTNFQIFHIRHDGSFASSWGGEFDPFVIINENTSDEMFKVSSDGGIHTNYTGTYNSFDISNPLEESPFYQIRYDGNTLVKFKGDFDPIVYFNELSNTTVYTLGKNGGIDMNCSEDVAPFAVRRSSSNENLFRVRNDGGMDLFMLGDSRPLTITKGNGSQSLFEIHSDGGMNITFDRNAGGLLMYAKDEATDEEIIAIGGDGKIWCKGIVVKHTPFWGDYVFEAGYKRPTLYELDTYLTENKHLPEMPTAECIAEEGADIYEVIRVLTIKVEELTLYTIEQQKEIDRLKLNQNERNK